MGTTKRISKRSFKKAGLNVPESPHRRKEGLGKSWYSSLIVRQFGLAGVFPRFVRLSNIFSIELFFSVAPEPGKRR
jgi:hypothetical protein